RRKAEEYEGALYILLHILYDDLGGQWEKIWRALHEKEAVKKPEHDPADYSLERLSAEERAEAVARVGIHGHRFNGRFLTVNDLGREGLLPEYKITADGTTVWLASEAYELGDARYAVV